jgi:hypothetical protein
MRLGERVKGFGDLKEKMQVHQSGNQHSSPAQRGLVRKQEREKEREKKRRRERKKESAHSQER